jgi:hypothetical protein
MPPLPGFGLQLVDVEAGQCTIRKMDGKLHILNVPKETAAKILHWQQHGGLIQDVAPELTASQRELLLTGIDDEEWDRIFNPDEDDDKQLGSEDEDEPAF